MKNVIEFDLGCIIDEYSNYVYKIVNNVVGASLSYQDREEIVSDVFYLLWKNQSRVESNIKAYLGTIARNCAYSRLRRINLDCEYIDDFDGQTYETENFLDIKEVFETLSDDEKVLFDLYYIRGFKVKEISKVLKIHVGTVKVRLYRIRKKIKEGLNE